MGTVLNGGTRGTMGIGGNAVIEDTAGTNGSAFFADSDWRSMRVSGGGMAVTAWSPELVGEGETMEGDGIADGTDPDDGEGGSVRDSMASPAAWASAEESDFPYVGTFTLVSPPITTAPPGCAISALPIERPGPKTGIVAPTTEVEKRGGPKIPPPGIGTLERGIPGGISPACCLAAKMAANCA